MSNEQQPKVLFTAFECDRCGKDNAIRLTLATKMVEDKKVFEEVDICSACMIDLCGALFSRIEMENREAWVQAFLTNVIG